MGYDLYSVLEACVLCGVALWLAGFIVLLIAVRKAGDEFRNKGYLKPLWGLDWFPFLLKKRFDAFANPSARSYFGFCHFCLIGGIVVFSAAVALIVCALVFGGFSEGL